MHRKLIILTLMLMGLNAQADKRVTGLLERAHQYMKAYSDWNIDAMSAMHHEAIQFNDPTATEAFKRSFAKQGKQEVADFLKGIFAEQRPEYSVFKISQHFVSGDHVVIQSTFESLLPKNWYGERAIGPVLVAIPITTILVFEGDKIISHTDYADYHSYQQQVGLQMEPATEKPATDQ